ncbi:hypothetical protein D8674_035045 [Pyrus ussuriensis x Pyrus communis]|uniref:RNase H type-1 domain-containing protein n=1 Tax=Pyrus ussuriensis x Pyrus communis TaxID=2448454 RepID=A0A5N5GB99_9ROSA|nr:hypothetical protein D8674_035045 [Pyrus ussuriensis x Pyrus communis]
MNRRPKFLGMGILDTKTEPIRSRSRFRSCPPSSRIKVNVDGAWDKENNVGGVGVVFRDSEGKLLGAISRIFEDVFPPIQVETAVEWGLNMINFESDSL